MKDEIIKYETAVLAKEKGCDLDLFGEGFNYTNEDGDEYWTSIEGGISGKEETSPVINCTQSLLQRWLREVHSIRAFVVHGVSGNFNYEIRIFDKPNDAGQWTRIGHISSYDTYESVLEARLLEALKLIK